jgi:hypothetical protein
MVVDGLSVVAAVEACYIMAKELYKYVERMIRFGQEVRTTIRCSINLSNFSKRRKSGSTRMTEAI